MHDTGKQLLNLMFREGETICISPNKYGYHSIPVLVAQREEVTLLATKFRDGIELENGTTRQCSQEECLETYSTNELRLVALNPIKGWCDDASCYKWRNFLIEMDVGPLPEQLAYIKRLEMPYSAVVFSGGKSLHFLISLETDLPNEETYRKIAEWILTIVTMADQNTKNPSRRIRIPGVRRDDKWQALVELKGAVTNEALGDWLRRYPDAMPKERERLPIRDNIGFPRMKPWMVKALHGEFPNDKGRNKTWFAIACEFAIAGFNEDESIELLRDYFQPDRDFKEREWITTIRSAFKYIYENRG